MTNRLLSLPRGVCLQPGALTHLALLTTRMNYHCHTRRTRMQREQQGAAPIGAAIAEESAEDAQAPSRESSMTSSADSWGRTTAFEVIERWS